jgi:biopolymer transport protein TolR
VAFGGSRFGSDDEPGRMIVDINVTPLVDITLVLLIVFMVTAAFIVNPAIKVDLPKAASGTEQTRTVLGLTLMKDGALYLNGERSSDEAIGRAIGRSPTAMSYISSTWSSARASIGSPSTSIPAQPAARADVFVDFEVRSAIC